MYNYIGPNGMEASRQLSGIYKSSSLQRMIKGLSIKASEELIQGGNF
jgi:hypothetical protein